MIFTRYIFGISARMPLAPGDLFNFIVLIAVINSSSVGGLSHITGFVSSCGMMGSSGPFFQRREVHIPYVFLLRLDMLVLVLFLFTLSTNIVALHIPLQHLFS
jgi:hypothetical protein